MTNYKAITIALDALNTEYNLLDEQRRITPRGQRKAVKRQMRRVEEAYAILVTFVS